MAKYRLSYKGTVLETIDADSDEAARAVAMESLELCLDDSTSPAPKRLTIPSRWRDLNSKMKGIEAYRMAVDGDKLVWIENHPDVVIVQKGMVSRGIRSSERHCEDKAEVPEGLIVLTIKKSEAVTKYEAGRVQVCQEDSARGAFYEGDGVKYVGSRREGGSFTHIIEIDGIRKEFRNQG